MLRSCLARPPARLRGTLAAALLGLLAAQEPEVVAPPPPELKADPWYAKHLDAEGLPVLSSPKVSDRGLREARRIVTSMLKNRPDVLQEMARAGVRVVVMHETEVTTDVPEHRDLKPKEYWDRRARGLGGRITSCGEENLFQLPGDRYRGESILVHEFGHTVKSHGLERIDKEFKAALKALYKAARDKGLWEKTYAGQNADEYWAEAVQDYFDCNLQSARPNGIHNHVNTREELKAYDPALFEIVDRAFKQVDWQWAPPAPEGPPK